MPLTIEWPEIVLAPALAVLAGALLGINRTERGMAAGLRTTLLVTLAAAVSMIQVNLHEELPQRRRHGSQAEEALRLSEERYRALVEATSQAVLVLVARGGPGNFSRTQQWWERVDGQTPDEQSASTTGWLDVVHPEDRATAAAVWEKALAAGTRYEIEYRVRAKTGGWRHVHARGIPISRPERVGARMVGTLDDVTEQRRAEADLRRARPASGGWLPPASSE